MQFHILTKAIEISSFYYEKGGWANCVEYRTLEGNSPIAFSPDSKLLASTRILSIAIYDIGSSRLIRTLEAKEPLKSVGASIDLASNIQAIAFSPVGKLLAIGGVYYLPNNSYNGVTEVWNIENGRLIWWAEAGYENYVRSVAFSPNGKLLACGGDQGIVPIFNAEDGRLIKTFEKEMDIMGSISWKDEKSLAIIDYDGKGLVYNVENDRVIKQFEALKEIVQRKMTVSPHHKFLAHLVEIESVAPRKNTVEIFDISNGWDNIGKRSLIRTLEVGPGYMIDDLRFSPDGRLLAVASRYEREIKIWKANY